MMRTPIRLTVFVLCLAFLSVSSSCTRLLTSTIIEPTVGNLQKQQDVDLVCEGAASYLLMIDSLLESGPENRNLLRIGVQAYAGSTAALASCDADPERISAISVKAKDYGKRLISTILPINQPHGKDFSDNLANLSSSDASHIFWGAFGWLSWIQQQHGSPQSMADLIVVERLMHRLIELDDTLENGSLHLFFGILHGAKPLLAGGNPELSKTHFERALELSDRKFLTIQTTYAETYCRMTFNHELHDALLNEVLSFSIDDAPDFALVNQIAKRHAQKLLDERFFD